MLFYYFYFLVSELEEKLRRLYLLQPAALSLSVFFTNLSTLGLKTEDQNVNLPPLSREKTSKLFSKLSTLLTGRSFCFVFYASKVCDASAPCSAISRQDLRSVSGSIFSLNSLVSNFSLPFRPIFFFSFFFKFIYFFFQ